LEMKHQQVVPDYVVMLESSVTVLALVACGWLLFKFVFESHRFSDDLRGFPLSRLVSACVWFPQYMKNLELEADKANRHVEATLMPKGTIEEENEEEQAGPSKPTETSEDSDDSPPETEDSPTETTPETKKEK
jgi:hypothetical protein